MKNPSPGTTRASLFATAAASPRIFGSGASTGALLSASLIGALSLAGSAQAGENNWLGVDTNWNNTANWSFGRVPVTPSNAAGGFDDALINNTTIFPVVTVSPNRNFRELKIGLGNGNNGRVDLRAGTIQSANWMLIGSEGATGGTFNIANTGTATPGLTNFAQGTGSFYGGNVLMVGRSGNGTLNINTTGHFSGNELNIGDNNAAAQGFLNFQSGTMYIGQLHVGRRNGTGTAVMTGGNIWVGGDLLRIGHESDSHGNLTLSGGTIRVNSQTAVSRSQGVNGTGNLTVNGGFLDTNEFSIAQDSNGDGIAKLDSGKIESRNWVRIGGGGSGNSATLEVNGGLFRNSNDNFILADNGGSATVTQTAGEISINNDSWIGNNNGTNTATLTISGGIYRTGGRMLVGFSANPSGGFLTISGGTVTAGNYVNVGDNNSAVGTVTLNGGVLNTGALRGGPGSATAIFNGGILRAQRNDGEFLQNFDSATIQGGNLKIDSSVYNVTASQGLTGTGGVVKSGPGTLRLTGASSYAGAATVDAGSLILSNNNSANGAIVVNGGGTLAINEDVYNDTVSAVSTGVTFAGTNPSLSIALTDNGVGPRNANTPLLDVNGTLDLGTNPIRVNVSDINAEIEQIPLITYDTLVGNPALLVAGQLANGAIGTVVHNVGAKTFYLNVTGFNYLEWDGAIGESWTSSGAWADAIGGGLDVTYSQPAGVLFSNLGIEQNVQLNTPVTPLQTNFDASIDYTISGAGSIGGTGQFLKRGTGRVILGTTNSYSGSTRIENGVVEVGALAPAGANSPLGVGTTDPNGLSLAGGTLDYSGAASVPGFNRGIRVDATSGFSITNAAANVTMTAPLLTQGGNFRKEGAGTLTLTNVDNSFNDVQVTGGAFNFDGTGATPTAPQIVRTNRFDIGVGLNTTANVAISGNTRVHARDLIRMGFSGSGTMVMSGSAQVIQTGGWMSLGNDDDQGARASGTLTLQDNAVFDHTSGGDFNIGDTPNTEGTLNISGNATFRTRGHGFWGKDDNCKGEVNVSGGLLHASGWQHTSENANSSSKITQTGGRILIEDHLQIAERGPSKWEQSGGEAYFNVNHIYIGQSGDAEWKQSAGTTVSSGWVIIGRLAGSDNTTMDISGGTFRQAGIGQGLVVAEEGKAVVTVRDAGVLDSWGGDIEIASRVNSVGTLNVNNNGVLRARRIYEQNRGTSTLSFDGGILVANPGANGNFMEGIDTETIGAGGLTVDSNSQSIAFNQILQGTGALTKIGPNKLHLNGVNTYGGTTTVNGGSLGGTGSVPGTVTVAAAAALSPGSNGAGTFTAGTTTVSGAFTAEINAGTSGKLVTTGPLNISAATLNVTELNPHTARTYVIATYSGATPAPFAVVNAPGFTINYAYNDGVSSNNIALTSTASEYQLWINGYASSIALADRDPGDDPDTDGSTNLLEFALNGLPNNGTNSGLVRVLAQNTGGPATNELTLVAAVRDGAVFAAGPNGIQRAIKDGIQYDIEGSVNLVFPSSTVSHVGSASNTAPAATGLPDLTGTPWEYHTFRLDVSEGLPTKGFLRVNAIANP